MKPDYDKNWTIKDYFELDSSSEIRYEYLDGQIYAMSGGT